MRSGAARILLASAACLSMGLLAVPTSHAQTAPADPWTGSSITSPAASVSTSTITVSGAFENATRYDDEVLIEVGRSTGDSFDDADDDACVPTDPGLVDADVTVDDDDGSVTIAFASAPIRFGCNGDFAVTARLQPRLTSPVLQRNFRIAAPPAPVPSVAASVTDTNEETGATADDPSSIAVGWKPIDTDPYKDFLGYRVLRTGPGDQGTTVVSGTNPIDHHSEEDPFTDQVEAPGQYTYAVEAVRAGPDGNVRSGATSSEPVRVSGPAAAPDGGGDGGDEDDEGGDGDGSGVTQPPTTSRLTIPEARAGAGSRRSSGITVPRTPGTIDTGFDEELDYGERSGDSEPGDENALAGEGQSVIRTDEAGPGLLGPVAGALVLLGWAGHVAYLNRLARQF